MSTLKAAGYVRLTAAHLTASASDRTIEGLVVPFGEVGHAAIDGEPRELVIEAGGLVWGDDPSRVTLVQDHRGEAPVYAGRAVDLRETDPGVAGVFRIADTTAGHDALVEAAEEFRAGLSIEADLPDPITPTGVVTITAANPGILRRVALVETPAFATARVHKAAAAKVEAAPATTNSPAPANTAAAEVPDEALAAVIGDLTSAVSTLNEALAQQPVAPEEAPAEPAAAASAMPARKTAAVTAASKLPTAGDYMKAFITAGMHNDRGPLDRMRQAIAGHSAEAATQAVTDTAGIIPVPIVGEVQNLIDASRPIISGGVRRLPMPAQGATFKRPRISQRTTVATQAAEHDALSSQKMTVAGDTVTKVTKGGYVTVSEQDVDWSDPSALQLLIQDLAEQYAVDTDNYVADALVTAATGAENADISAASTFIAGLATAAAESYAAAGKMADTLYCAPDAWSGIVGLVDTTGRPVFPYAGPQNAGGTSDYTVLSANPFGLKMVVDANFAAGTCILGPSQLYEFYEQDKGHAQIDSPSTLGVTVAYRGYIATWCSTAAGAAFIELDLTV